MTVAPQDDRDDIGCVASPSSPTLTITGSPRHNEEPSRSRLHGDLQDVLRVRGGAYNFDLFATCGSPGVNKACSDPAKFVNWDGVHLTEAMYKAVANMFFNRGYCRPGFDVLLSSKGDAAK
uniref:GDSL esterase/lipase n=1 Tax=Ananas comosus var. bracteatus TaxID=296719 RepID=A0A6V7QTA6_ANACO